MKDNPHVPKGCPMGCGTDIVVKKATYPNLGVTMKFKWPEQFSQGKIDLDNCYGILCNKCGYATVTTGWKK